jgi:hypothetical protein
MTQSFKSGEKTVENKYDKCSFCEEKSVLEHTNRHFNTIRLCEYHKQLVSTPPTDMNKAAKKTTKPHETNKG